MVEFKRVVVIGATGNFGRRICRRLLGEPNMELVVTSRNIANAESLANELRTRCPDAKVRAAKLDQTVSGFETDLEALQPDIAIHTAGPYQAQDYRVARACIDCGSHYVDLADGREFVQGFDQLNEAARRRGVLLVSGASTLPGLSSAVIHMLQDRFDQINTIEISIAPAHQTPRGTGTIAAVLSYCGKPFPVLVDGHWVTMHGWQNMRLQRYPELGVRLSGACDVPDLVLLPDDVDGVKTVTFHAALEAKWEQITLWLMGWLTRLRIIRDWRRCIPLLRWLGSRLVRLGSDSGGMQVRLSGAANDESVRSVTWDLTAHKNHGPEIPVTPALILARRLLRDKLSLRGAYPCLGLITMVEFDDEVGDLEIEWSINELN